MDLQRRHDLVQLLQLQAHAAGQIVIFKTVARE